MDASVSSTEIVLRLGAALLAGGLIGFDRGTRGRIAGLRTTILICVAAAGAMIEANLTLEVNGKTSESFTVMDALRFPLGILSGIGFIGAGAIVKRGDLVSGVTTAATLWVVTVIGLVLGGGYYLLGALMVGIVLVSLALLVHIEPLMWRQHRAELAILIAAGGPSDGEITREISSAGYKIGRLAIEQAETQRLSLQLTWNNRHGIDVVPPIVAQLGARAGVLSVDWKPLEWGQHSA